uniref:Uncharacterized protein n=1 Tax=Caenorhabditis japonica TaxID=281687 RepID=A0A8R1ICB3_CAEJA
MSPHVLCALSTSLGGGGGDWKASTTPTSAPSCPPSPFSSSSSFHVWSGAQTLILISIRFGSVSTSLAGKPPVTCISFSCAAGRDATMTKSTKLRHASNKKDKKEKKRKKSKLAPPDEPPHTRTGEESKRRMGGTLCCCSKPSVLSPLDHSSYEFDTNSPSPLASNPCKSKSKSALTRRWCTSLQKCQELVSTLSKLVWKIP